MSIVESPRVWYTKERNRTMHHVEAKRLGKHHHMLITKNTLNDIWIVNDEVDGIPHAMTFSIPFKDLKAYMQVRPNNRKNCNLFWGRKYRERYITVMEVLEKIVMQDELEQLEKDRKQMKQGDTNNE